MTNYFTFVLLRLIRRSTPVTEYKQNMNNAYIFPPKNEKDCLPSRVVAVVDPSSPLDTDRYVGWEQQEFDFEAKSCDSDSSVAASKDFDALAAATPNLLVKRNATPQRSPSVMVRWHSEPRVSEREPRAMLMKGDRLWSQ